MKKDTHPTYFLNAIATCACGNKISVGSTMEKIDIEICSACHPFYTGNEKVLDTAGRLEKFNARRSGSVKKATKTPAKVS